MDKLFRTVNPVYYNDSSNLTDAINSPTTPSTLDILSNELIDYFETHREQIPLLVIVYLLTIIWILYIILYHSRIQGIILSYLLRRFYFKDSAQIKFDSFSISFISGAIMFRNLHYTTGSYFVFVKDGCLVFRYWTRTKNKPLIRLKIKLYHLDIQFFSPIRSHTLSDLINVTTNPTDDLQRGSINGISNKGDDTQSVNTVKSSEEGVFIKRLRSLFPAVDIKVEHGRISAGHDSLPYGLLIRFSTMTSTFQSISPARMSPQIDVMTLLYTLKYRNLRVQLYPIRVYDGELRELPPPIPTSKPADSGIFQVFECSDGELEYEQDVPGKMIESTENIEAPAEVTWEIRMRCHKEVKIAYAPWADRQREALWQYFLPTLYEECPITLEPTVGQTRIFKTVRYKLWFNCPIQLDLYFMHKKKLHQLHADLPKQNSYFDASFPFSTNPDGFDTFVKMNLFQPTVRTNLSFSPLFQAERVDLDVHIHYPRMWNAIQDWFVNIDTEKAQVYFIFEHKNFFQSLIADWSSTIPPDIYSFSPFIYNITLRGSFVEVFIPSNQGNWIDCSNGKTPQENNYVSVCAKSFFFTYPLPFLEFCPKATPMELTIEVTDILARLIIPENNRMYQILEGIDAHKKFYTPKGIQSELDFAKDFPKRDGSFDCGQVNYIKIVIEILLHTAPPIDSTRSDLLYNQHVKSMGNRQTFHPNKLDYDLFNINIEISPIHLLLHGLFLKKLWWLKENLFGWDQMFHDIREPELIREKKIIVHDDPLDDLIDESQPFDPRYFRPLMVTLRVSLHNITAHLLQHTDNEPCPIAFCERLCFEMTTDLDETRLQLLFLPVHVYVEDTINRNKSDQHLSTGSLQLSGLIIRGHAMLSHEGLPPERETLEYAWQMEILLGHISARVTTIQSEKIVSFLKNFYLQMMEDEYTLVRSPYIDKTKWIEKLKYDVLRFSLDSIDLNLVEVGNAVNVRVAPVRLCMCNLHTYASNENLTLKVGLIHIRQLLRLYPGSWLEAGSISLPELRLNAKFECHPPTAPSVNEQLEFLRRHDQHSQRLHFLSQMKSLSTLNVQTNASNPNLKRPSNVGLASNAVSITCACLGGSPNYYTLVQGEQFFKSTFFLSDQPSFGRSLFRPELHVIHSHPIFKDKYSWDSYDYPHHPSSSRLTDENLNDEEIFYPFDFCSQPKPSSSSSTDQSKNDLHELRHSMPANLSLLSRSNSTRHMKHQSVIDNLEHKRSSSSIPLNQQVTTSSSSSNTTSDVYLTPDERQSLSINTSQSSLNSTLLPTIITNPMETSSISSLTMIQPSLSTQSSPLQSHLDILAKSLENRLDDGHTTIDSSRSSSSDSLNALEEILQRQQTQQGSTFLRDKTGPSTEYPSIPATASLTSSSWISLRNQMKMPIPKSTLLCTTYIRYLSHYRSSTWSKVMAFPPTIQSDQIDSHPILDFNCISQGFSCSFLSDVSNLSQSFTSPPSRPTLSASSSTNSATTGANPTGTSNTMRPRLSIAPTTSPSGTTSNTNPIPTEREVCLRLMGALEILLTPLMLECLTTYIEKWKTFELHPISILDGLHIQAQQNTPIQSSPTQLVDLSSTKISFQLPKITVCLLQAGLAEDNVQLTELRTPMDIVTMSLFTLSCKQILLQTILSNRDQSTAGVFKIQSITGQFRRFENDFSSMDQVNIHAIQSQRCRLQFRLSSELQTHLPLGENGKNVGFVMNEFGLQRVCFKLVNNAAKQQQRQQPLMTQVDETQNPTTTRAASSKQKSKRKQSAEPLLPSPSAANAPNSVSISSPSMCSSSSSVFDGSIDHIWISFPEPPHHHHHPSSSSSTTTTKRSRTSTTTGNPSTSNVNDATPMPPAPKKLFSYTRYDWNFLSTLSPTVLGWFCVINRIQKPMEEFLQQREKRIDTIIAYFLIETTPKSTLPSSKFFELFTPKCQSLLNNPVCQLVNELRKQFNRNTQMSRDLQPNLIPEIQVLKQGIREACRGWAQTIKQSPSTTNKTPASAQNTSPINTIIPTMMNVDDPEQPPAVVRAPTVVDRVQRFIGHEFVMAHPRQPSINPNSEHHHHHHHHSSGMNGSAIRRRTNNTKETGIEMVSDHSQEVYSSERRRASSFLGDALRRFEPVPNVNNTNGYKRLSMAVDESDYEGRLLNESRHDESFTETAFYTDVGPEFAGPVEQLFKSLLEYAGVELSVASSIEPLFEKLGQSVLATILLKRFDVKILPNEPINDTQTVTLPSISITQPTNTTVQYRVPTPGVTNRPSILTTTSSHQHHHHHHHHYHHHYHFHHPASILSVTNLNIQSVCRQSLDHDQLHSANVQAGIRVQRVQQEVNLSFIRLVYQFYTVVCNALEYTGIDEMTKTTDADLALTVNNNDPRRPQRNILDYPEAGIENLVFHFDHPFPNDDQNHPERQCWKKLRQLVAIYGTKPEVKQVQTIAAPAPANPSRKQQRSGSQPPNENLPSLTNNTGGKNPSKSIMTNPSNETLLLSSFGWLIIDEIYYAASLGGLKVDGCMGKVQGSVTLSQRLRAIQSINYQHHSKKYDGSLIVQIGSTSLCLKETLSDSQSNNIPSHPLSTSINPSNATTRQISVLDIIVGKSRALLSLQTRGINLTLSGVTNIGTIAMDVPLRPQEVHDLVNRAGRLITSYVQEFLPDDNQGSSNPPSNATASTTTTNATTTNVDHVLINTSLNDTIEETSTPQPSERRTTKRRRKHLIASKIDPRPLEAQQSLSSNSRRPIFEAHITAHCQGMTFSTTLLSTLKAQYKIGVVEGVANIGGATSRFTAIVHEHALHFLNNNNDYQQPPFVSSDNHVRIDFPQIRCYGNYALEQGEQTKTKGHLNLRTKIDLLKLTITADFLAQLVFVSRVIIHEMNEILAKVSGFDQFRFGGNEKSGPSSNSSSKGALMHIGSTDDEDSQRDGNDDNDDDDDDEQEQAQNNPPTTPFTYKIDISIKGFEVIGQTPSNTIVKFENGDKKVPIFIKLTNYDAENSLLFYSKPLINASLNIKLSLGQLLHSGSFQDAAYFKTKLLLRNSFQSDDAEKEAYFIRLTKPSFYWQPGAIDKGILFWLNYKNTYEHWNEQRGAFTTPTVTNTTNADPARLRSIVNPSTSPVMTKELNLMFQLHIVDLGIAIPLQQSDLPTKLTNVDSHSNQHLPPQPSQTNLEESSDFLVFTLDKTTISACSCGAIISSGSFEGFCFRFAENFQQTNKSWKPARSLSSSPSNVILNACCVPSGQYLMHSRARNILHTNSPKWYLNVQWDMKGIDIHLDSIIGKRFSQLIRTITSTHLIEPTDRRRNETNSLDDEPSNHHHHPTQGGSTMNLIENDDQSEEDERIKRLEYEHLILGQKIETMKRSQTPYEILKPELIRYEWLEKELLQTVKSEIQLKMKKQSNKPTTQPPPVQTDILRRSTFSTTGYTRDRTRTGSPSSSSTTTIHKRTPSHEPISASHLESTPHQSSIQEDENEDVALQSPTSFLSHRTTSSYESAFESLTSQEATIYDDHHSTASMNNITPNPNEITSAPAVDFELNVQIQIASGSCNLYTRRDLISHTNKTTSTPQPTPQPSQPLVPPAPNIVGSTINVNKVEYQVSQFSLPGVDVDAHYNSKHTNTTNSSLNKRASFYCRAMVQSPTTQITIHPLLLDFLEQTLEHVSLPKEHERMEQEQNHSSDDQDTDTDHLNTIFLIEDQSSTVSFPIDVVVSLFIQPSVLLFTCLPTHPMECELRLPTVDVVFSSKRAASTENLAIDKNPSNGEQIVDYSVSGLSFSLYMKDFKLNVYHPFSGESKVQLFEDIRSGQLQTRNALAVSVQSVSFNISRTRYTVIRTDGEFFNRIQLSVIGQISKAQFEYDIRRFSEILTFPKIWYNRSLARRLFLGDENLSSTQMPSTDSATTVTRPISTPVMVKSKANKRLRKEARVLLAIQLKELHVSMRMSNVMGKVEWNTTDVCSTGRLTLTSEGQRSMYFSIGLQKSIFQAEQGIVGGIIRLKNLRTTGLLRQGVHDRSLLHDSSHVFDVLTDAIEVRLDYMGSPTLMGRICHILLRLKDDHHGQPTHLNSGHDLTSPSTLVVLNLEWSQLHLMITRSTTPDMIKMSMKLKEFFETHVTNSKKFLASIQYDFHREKTEKKTSTGQSKYDTNLIKRCIGMHGGELMLQGHNLTLIVFHGLNFKSRQWALFSLNEPQINFVTDRGENGDINQKLFFVLGYQNPTMAATPRSRTNMASISKVTRNTNEAPSHLTIHEWFNYASSTISAVGLRDFPSMEDIQPATPSSKSRSKQFEKTSESIFILPSLELRFQTRQLDGQVHCSFETEFYEHIMFSFNAEHFYFLHDLISSYIKEKERALTATSNEKHHQNHSTNATTTTKASRTSAGSVENQSTTLTAFEDARSDDHRRFHIPDTKWKLQPTIKLLTAYGNEVEPFGADYILQKLGFRHARLTIPKWLQRGIMDPCEQSMAIVQLFLIFLLPERFKELCMRH